MKKKQRNTGIVAFPLSERGLMPLSNLIDIIYPISNEVHLITGGAGYSYYADDERLYAYEVKHKATKVAFARAICYVCTQLKISWKLIKLRNNVDIWILFIGGEGLVLPVIAAKLLRKNVVLASAGSAFKVALAQRDPLAKVSAFLQSITYDLSDKIIIYSERLIDEHRLQKYIYKISIAHKHFLDFDKLKVNKKFSERRNLVGYIGGLFKAKGIVHLLQAIPCIIGKKDGVNFLIGGEGELRSEIEKMSNGNDLSGKVKFVGWIPHDGLPRYLNNMKLLVLPSYTEGLPNIILEAMACGTPVLATPVGGIPDFIEDGKTGFLMENNSPECIAANVIRALEHPDLEGVTRRARTLVEREFTFERAVERWEKVLEEI